MRKKTPPALSHLSNFSKWALYASAVMALTLSLSSCDVFDSLAEADKTLIQQIQGTKEKFTPIADGYSLSVISYGTKGKTLLFLTPEGTVLWNQSENTVERFGGDLPTLSSSGPIYADTQGNLSFNDRLGSLYHLKSGETQWQKQAFAEILPSDFKEYRAVAWAVGQTGAEIAAVKNASTGAYLFMKRSQATASFAPWFQLDKNPKQFYINDLDDLHLQPNGSVLVTNADKPWIIPAGTQEPKAIFDCSAILNKYCGARVFLRDNGHNKIYAIATGTSQTQIYKIPENATFPVIPETLPVLPHGGNENGGVLLDPQGDLWAILIEKNAETLPVAPFTRDVATLLQLQGNRWVSKKTFYSGENCCIMGPDKALYKVGFQLAAGGVYVGQPVYRLGF